MITKYEEFCILCGKPSAHIHHLCGGRGIRKLADEDGLTAPLCEKCHEVVHNDMYANRFSKICGQLAFEKDLIEKGEVNGDEAREKFRKRFGRSYL